MLFGEFRINFHKSFTKEHVLMADTISKRQYKTLKIKGFIAGIHELFPASICLFKIISRNTSKRCDICSKLTIKTAEYVNAPPPLYQAKKKVFYAKSENTKFLLVNNM